MRRRVRVLVEGRVRVLTMSRSIGVLVVRRKRVRILEARRSSVGVLVVRRRARVLAQGRVRALTMRRGVRVLVEEEG